jgi:hypothetical protein
MLIRIAPRSAQGDFGDYLRRLGCTVTLLDETTLDACVTYPETVEDEWSALSEWCRTWVESPRARGRTLEIMAAVSTRQETRDRRDGLAFHAGMPEIRPVFDL